jgi:hypothetical protein
VKEPLQFPESLPPVPDDLTGTARDLFIRIVNEMADARVGMLPEDSAIVAGLAIDLYMLQCARAELAESREEELAEALKKIVSEQWALVVETAKPLMLSEEAIKCVLREH